VEVICWSSFSLPWT